MLVIGWEVPHAHIHLIPTNAIHEVGMPPAANVSEEDMGRLAALLAP